MGLRSALALALLFWVYQRVDLRDTARAVAEAPGWLWPTIVVAFLVNTLLYVLRVAVLFPRRLPLLRMLRAVLVANFMGLALPSGGGEAAKVLTLGPEVGGRDQALATVVVARLAELLVWASLLLWAALAVLPARVPELLPVAWLGALAFGGVSLLGLGIVPVPHSAMRRLPGRLGAYVQRSARAFSQLRTRRRRVVASILLSLPFAAVNALVAWLVLNAYGAQISLPHTLGLQPTMDVLISLPVTISGIGVREATFVAATRPFGASPEAALAMAYTRWSGHLVRASLGGLLFAIGRRAP